MIILPKFQKNRLIFKECSTASKFPMLSLWRIFVLRGSMRSECKNTVLYISRCQNRIEYNKIKISSEFEKFGISGLPTSEGKKIVKNVPFFRFLTICGWQSRYPKFFKLAGNFNFVIVI